MRIYRISIQRIIRGLQSRDNWKRLRDQRMNQEIIDPPTSIKSPQSLSVGKIPDVQELGLEKRELVDRPIPEKEKRYCNFVFPWRKRATVQESYVKSISCKHCMLSIIPLHKRRMYWYKQILHHTGRKARIVKVNPRSKENLGWTGSIKSFQSRLAWHCHFIQRLDSELTMDTIALNDKLDSFLQRKMDDSLFHAWAMDVRVGLSLTLACVH